MGNSDAETPELRLPPAPKSSSDRVLRARSADSTRYIQSPSDVSWKLSPIKRHQSMADSNFFSEAETSYKEDTYGSMSHLTKVAKVVGKMIRARTLTAEDATVFLDDCRHRDTWLEWCTVLTEMRAGEMDGAIITSIVEEIRNRNAHPSPAIPENRYDPVHLPGMEMRCGPGHQPYEQYRNYDYERRMPHSYYTPRLSRESSQASEGLGMYMSHARPYCRSREDLSVMPIRCEGLCEDEDLEKIYPDSYGSVSPIGSDVDWRTPIKPFRFQPASSKSTQGSTPDGRGRVADMMRSFPTPTRTGVFASPYQPEDYGEYGYPDRGRDYNRRSRMDLHSYVYDPLLNNFYD